MCVCCVCVCLCARTRVSVLCVYDKVHRLDQAGVINSCDTWLIGGALMIITYCMCRTGFGNKRVRGWNRSREQAQSASNLPVGVFSSICRLLWKGTPLDVGYKNSSNLQTVQYRLFLLYMRFHKIIPCHWHHLLIISRDKPSCDNVCCNLVTFL